jgi:hypothetical protein
VTQFRTFTDAERAALKLHGLDIHRPSQLADAFVLGMRYANEQAAQSPAPALPDVLFDGYSVLQAMNEDARKRTSPENVSDVLDAVVRLLKSPAPAAPAPTDMRAEFQAWVQDQGCDTDGAWSAWQGCWNLLASSMAQWQDIATAPKDGTREMFVVKAFNVCNGFTGGKPYTSDPWCVWRESDGSFSRWPHHFPPTHWHPLSAAPEAK